MDRYLSIKIYQQFCVQRTAIVTFWLSTQLSLQFYMYTYNFTVIDVHPTTSTSIFDVAACAATTLLTKHYRYYCYY